MSRTYKDSPKSKGPGRGRARDISVRAVRRDPPDLRKLARALITLAMDEAAAEAAETELDASDNIPELPSTPTDADKDTEATDD